uniref:Bromodomain associated domain-containing protein n=1 Tax=Strigamia maritima TaxID=126957 RepID=T1IY18_STRMM
MENVRWGDLPVIPDTESGIAAIEREQIIKPRSMELEGPQLYQPCSTYQAISELSSETIFKDNIVIRTIKLIQHAKKLRTIVQSFQLQQENQAGKPIDVDGAFVYPPLPPMPLGVEEIPSLQESLYTEIEHKAVVTVEMHRLDQQSAFQILNKAVAIICAHVGFEGATSSVLRILTDVIHDFYIKFTHSLRAAADKNNIGFIDIFEQVSHEMSIGSLRSLQSFHEKRIVNYHNHVWKQCKQLMAEYERLKQPDQQNEDVKIVKVKEENMSQIQFPVSEEQEEMLDQNESVIHFEELHVMEHSTTLGDDEAPKWISSHKHESSIQHHSATLDSDDEIIEVSDSPEDTGMHVDLINIPTNVNNGRINRDDQN